jgi:outer membrane protein assembly factor BamA
MFTRQRTDGGLKPPLQRGARRAARPHSALRVAAFALLLLLLLLPALLRAQTPATAETTAKVASVKIIGSKRFPEEDLARDIGLAPGTAVNREQIQAAADRLSGLGWFSGVSYKFKTTAKGVEIEFTLHDAPSARLWFDNFPWFSDAELGDAIRAAGLPYDGTAPEGGTALDAIREAVAGLLKARHIPGEVEGDLVQAPESSGMVERFRVTGAELPVVGIEFSDAIARNDEGIAHVLNSLTGKPYSRYALAIFLVEQVRPVYISQGYLHARFGEPVALFAGDPGKPLANEVTIRVPIERGVQYHWGGIKWPGQIVLTQEMRDDLLGMISGEPADGMKLQAGWQRVAREYKRRGYLDVKVTPTLDYNDAEARVTCTVDVAEGSQYRMGKLVLTGLSLAAERLMLSNWKLARGDVFDQIYYEDFVNDGARKIFQNTPVHFSKIGHLMRPNAETKTVEVLLDFQ